MIQRVARVAQLAAGRYTPFLAANWNEEERELARRWRGGAELEEAAGELTEAMLATYGDGWRGWATNLGRSALQLALEGLNLPRGSEVVVPAFACAGVVVPVLQAGHRPVFVDVDEELNPSFESVLAADSPDVRAVVLPHFGGLWSRDAEAILDWAEQRGVAVIEDVAQAQGLRRNGRPAGSFGRGAIFSFGGGKVLFGPGGGFLLTRDAELAARAEQRLPPREERSSVDTRLASFCDRFAVPRGRRARRALRELVAYRLGRHGPATPPMADEADPHGFSVHGISGLEAALARAQLRKLDTILAARARHASLWRSRLESVPGLRLAPGAANVFTKLWVVAERDESGSHATRIRTILHRHGVETETLYVPLHLRREFSSGRAVPLPTTERLWRSVFAIPARPGLDAEDWKRIDAAVDEIRSENGG
jgi:perosamine synthetase